MHSKRIKTEEMKKIMKPTIMHMSELFIAVMHSSELWTLSEKEKLRINATKMSYLRRIEDRHEGTEYDV